MDFIRSWLCLASSLLSYASTGAALYAIIEQNWFTLSAASAGTVSDVSFGLIQLCTGNSCGNIPYPLSPSSARELYAALGLTLCAILCGLLAGSLSAAIAFGCCCRRGVSRSLRASNVTATFLSFGCFLSAFVLSLAVKPSLESYYNTIENAARADDPLPVKQFSYGIGLWVALGGWCGFLLSTMVTVIDIVRWELEGGAKGVPAAFPTSGGNQQRSPSGVAVPAVDSPGMVNPSFNPMHGSP